MCGIAGIVSFKEKIDLQRLKYMTDVILHRGPDGEGHWIDPNGNVGLAHRRLSIIDLTENAKQPMQYLNRYTITFNGEIYNYIEIKKELILKGYKFQSESDTEVLMALYDLKKEKCLNDLDGMFAFAIWDSEEEKLFCARDRFGEKPFYYIINQNELVFASEIKQLFAAGVKKELEPQVLYYYFNFGIEGNPYAPEQSFYKQIIQLMPSTYLILDKNGKISLQKYWSLDTKQTLEIGFDNAVLKFTELFNTALKRRLRSDVPVGSCLSGGLDSSSIVLSIDKMKKEGQVQKTFSARFKDFDKDEGKYMEMVTKKARSVQAFETWLSEKDFVDNLHDVFKFQDEPFGGASVMAQYHVMKLAKQNGITVLIDGQGSDEYLVGYTPYFITYLNQLYGNSTKQYASEKGRMMELHGIKHHLSFNGKMQLKYPSLFSVVSQTKKAIIPSKPSQKKRSDHLHPELLNTMANTSDPTTGKDNSNLRQGVYDVINGIPFNALLRYADRNAMAHSVEVRLPFLFHELVEFANSLPDHYKINEGWSKYILRKSMDSILPGEITWRKDKIGFAAPQDSWFNSKEIQGLVSEAKSSLKRENILSGNTDPDPWKCLMVHLSYSNG